MKNKVKFISIILALIMVFSVVPMNAFAVNLYSYDVVTVDGEKYAVLTSYNGSAAAVTTPKYIDDYEVIGLANTFNGKTVEDITVSEGVKFIGAYTFSNLKGSFAHYISLPSTIEILGSYAFQNTRLINGTKRKFTLPEGLKVICNNAFTGFADFSTEVNLVIPDSVEKLGYNALAPAYNLRGVHIGKNAQFCDIFRFNYDGTVSAIEYNFREESENPFCRFWSDPLDNLTVDEDNPYYTSIDNALYTKDLKMLISAPVNKMLFNVRKATEDDEYDFDIPDGVEKIAVFAFYNQPVRKVKFSSSVQYIYGRAFYSSGLQTIEIPENTKLYYIGVEAFYLSKLGGNIVIPRTVKQIEQFAFKETNIESVDFEPTSICEIIGRGAFMSCTQLKNALIPASVSEINYGFRWFMYSDGTSNYNADTFRDCSHLEEITIEDNSKIKFIGYDFVTGCTALERMNFGHNSALTRVYFSEIENSLLEELDLSGCDNLTRFNWSLSGSNRLKRVDFSNTKIEVIHSNFSDCAALEEVVLPNNTVNIGNYAFKDCVSLATINLDNAIYEENAFENCPLIAKQASEKSRLIERDGVQYWKYDDHIAVHKSLKTEANIVISSEISGLLVTEIEDEAFKDDDLLTSIVLPASLKRIGENAFYHCRSLESVPELPQGLEEIGARAFYADYYYHFTLINDSLTIPNSVKTIGDEAFSGCRIKTLTIENGVQSIGEKAFYHNYGVVSIHIPKSVKVIGASAFAENVNLKSVVFKEGISLETLDSVFEYCSSLKNCEFPENMQLGALNKTFYFCENLEEVALPESLVTLGNSTFFYCRMLREITVPKNVTTLGTYIFGRSGVETVNFEEPLARIPAGTFYECHSLKRINLYGNDNRFIDLTNEDTTIDYAKLSDVVDVASGAFTGAAHFRVYYIIKADDETAIGEGEFKGNEDVEKVVIGGSVEEIRNEAFADCTNLEEAYIAETVTEIADTAFDNCENLTIISTAEAPAIRFAQKMNIAYRVVQSFVVAPIPDQIYTGKAVKPSLNVTQDGKALTAGKDYSAVYTNNVNIGTASVSIVGIGDYSIFGTAAKFNIVKAADVKNGWVKESGKWHYYKNGKAQSGWQKVNNKWYYMNAAGVMQTGWVKVNGKWYYLNTSGAMAAGWKRVNGIWYYFTSSGAMKTGWLKDNGKWYYLNADGSMRTADLNYKGKVYRFNGNGACKNP